MADVLELLVKKVLFDGTSVDDLLFSLGAPHGGQPQRDREWRENLDRLMNYLRSMMLGYENDEAQSLLKEVKVMAHELTTRSDVFMKDLKKVIQNNEEEGSIIRMEVRARQLAWHEHGDGRRDKMLKIIEELCNIRYGSSVDREEIVVGFDDEVETLLDHLTQTSIKHIQVISITGMAGLGKTTLARKLYRDPLIIYHFDIRAWTCVSQIYVKRDLLLGILSSFIYDITEVIFKMSDEQLGEKVYKTLKGRRYLVVLDDMWDCMAWNDLKIYFPDDKVGSRVLFTSRDISVSLNVGPARPSQVLRLRTTDESWDISQKKLFRTGICFPVLRTVGKEIAEKCEGLPLAIVIVAGLLKNQRSVSWWSEIASSLRSFLVRDPSQYMYMETLSLSYNHLPPHLRSCFLFVGVFPEDYDIPVKKLIWLWIAQGFIPQTGSKVLEDVAEDLLMDLIRKSLLMFSEKSADGRIKACRIHDLLRDFCLRKAKEEKFSPEFYMYAPIPASSSTIRDMVHAPASQILTGLCYPFELGIFQVDGSLISETYKSLTILDMESALISLFPSGVTQLANLRYLA